MPRPFEPLFELLHEMLQQLVEVEPTAPRLPFVIAWTAVRSGLAVVACILHVSCGATSPPPETATIDTAPPKPPVSAAPAKTATAPLRVPPAGTLGVGIMNDCAIQPGGTLRCWRVSVRAPSTVEDENGAPITDATFVSVAAYHGCVVRKNGSVWCFGNNAANVLGRETGRVRDFPRALEVRGLAGVASVYANANSTCALTRNGDAFCWGALDKWLSGARFDASTATPHRVVTFDVTQPHGLAPYYSSLVRWQGRELAWRGGDYTLPVANGTSEFHAEIRQYIRGSDFGCAVFTDGTVDCAGDVSRREVMTFAADKLRRPDGSYDYDRYITVPGESGRPLSGVVRIAAGDDYACVLQTGGDVLCWGSNRFGQVGDEGDSPRVVPHLVISGASDLTCDPHRCCARRTDEHVMCWGELGYLGRRTKPSEVEAL